MSKADDPRISTTNGKPPAPGLEDAGAPQPIGPDGQHGAYWVLSEEERKKNFVRPLRRSYRHIGIRPAANLRDLTPEEQERYKRFNYVKYEEYPKEREPVTGRFWTQEELDRSTRGCGGVTTMGLALCETYARDPFFYGSTFCCACGKHFPVAEFVWEEDGQVVGS